MVATASDAKAFYDRRYAGSYMATVDPVEARRVREVLRESVASPLTVLDYGCGRGSWAPVLEQLMPGARIAGTDISSVAVDRAAAALPSVEFRVMDSGRAPFAAESFDLVFSYHVLEHVDDLAASVADMSRLVRPGGQLFVALPCGNPGSLEYWLASHVEHGRVATSGGWRFAFEGRSHLRRLRTDELIEAFGASGLLLGRAAFGNHFWGAIEWMCRGGRVYVDNVLDPGRGHNGVARLLLRAGRAVLRLIAADFARSRRLGLATGIERLTTREWRIRKSSPDGSAQYLVFTRPPP